MRTRNLIMARVLKLQAQREKLERVVRTTSNPVLREKLKRQLQALRNTLRG